MDSTRYRPEFSVVPFIISGTDIRVDVNLPSWDTHYSFMEKPGPFEVGKIGDIKVGGSYRYYASPRPQNQEALYLHLEVSLRWVQC